MAFFTQLEQSMALPQLTQLFESDYFPEHLDFDESLVWYEEIAVKIIEEHGEQGLEYLLATMPRCEERRLSGILVSLCFVSSRILIHKRAMLVKLLISVLNDPREIILADTIYALQYLDCPGAITQILPFVNHSSPVVQAAALHFLSKCDFAIARPYLFAALDSLSPLLRQVAIDELEESQSVDALPIIRKRLSDEDADVRQAAQTALENLEEIPTENTAKKKRKKKRGRGAP